MISGAAPADLPGDGARLFGVTVGLAVTVGAIVWLLSGFEPPDFSRPVARTEAPTATLESCALTSDGAPAGGRHLGATVVLDNPTDEQVTAYLAVEFGKITVDGLGTNSSIGDGSFVVPANSERTVVVPIVDSTGWRSMDCSLEARLTP